MIFESPEFFSTESWGIFFELFTTAACIAVISSLFTEAIKIVGIKAFKKRSKRHLSSFVVNIALIIILSFLFVLNFGGKALPVPGNGPEEFANETNGVYDETETRMNPESGKDNVNIKNRDIPGKAFYGLLILFIAWPVSILSYTVIIKVFMLLTQILHVKMKHHHVSSKEDYAKVSLGLKKYENLLERKYLFGTLNRLKLNKSEEPEG